MIRKMLAGKIHRAAVTEVPVDYEGSITIDADLAEASGILPHEMVQVLDIKNGARLETYAIVGEWWSAMSPSPTSRRSRNWTMSIPVQWRRWLQGSVRFASSTTSC
jgi:hypothetical protein